jgi:hypothetical protein
MDEHTVTIIFQGDKVAVEKAMTQLKLWLMEQPTVLASYTE